MTGTGPVDKTGGTPSAPQPRAGGEGVNIETPKPKKIISILSSSGEKYELPVNNVPTGSLFTIDAKSGKKICMPTPEEGTFVCEGLRTTEEMDANGFKLAKIVAPVIETEIVKTETPEPKSVPSASRQVDSKNFKSGDNFDEIVQGLVADDSLHRKDIKHPGQTHTEMRFYQGGKIQKDGTLKGGKLVATVEKKDGVRTITDDKKHKFIPDDDGNIEKL